jgi:hypothetical protein
MLMEQARRYRLQPSKESKDLSKNKSKTKKKKDKTALLKFLQYSVEATSSPSHMTKMFLTFSRPKDDGGSPVLYYKVLVHPTACPLILPSYPYNISARCSVELDIEGSQNLYLPNKWQLRDATTVKDTNNNPNSLLSRIKAADHANWDLETVIVHDLYPHTRYKFQVAPCNLIGCGELSEVSNIAISSGDFMDRFTEIEMKGLDVIYGNMHLPSMLSGAIFNNSNASWVIINMVTQTLTLSDDDVILRKPSYTNMKTSVQRELLNPMKMIQQMESANNAQIQKNKASVIFGWRCHWSPRLVAIGPMTHELDQIFEGAIVVLTRGGEPLVHKVLRAQLAGAIGVIIKDSGNCKRLDQSCM